MAQRWSSAVARVHQKISCEVRLSKPVPGYTHAAPPGPGTFARYHLSKTIAAEPRKSEHSNVMHLEDSEIGKIARLFVVCHGLPYVLYFMVQRAFRLIRFLFCFLRLFPNMFLQIVESECGLPELQEIGFCVREVAFCFSQKS